VSGGTEFEVVFARPIRQPYRRAIDGGGTQLTEVAKHGFYTFNIDIYIDTDRQPGSGRIVTLPGRVAEVHSDFAWEHVVCLTPRPNMARSQLRRILLGRAKREHKAEQGTVVRQDVKEMSEQIQLDVADHTFFPTRINVIGPKVRFFVPDTFLGGVAEASWSYVVAVSAPDLVSMAQTRALEAGIVEIGRAGLMILPIRPGGQRFVLGSREPDTEMLPPLLDIIVPEGATQRDVLRSFDVLAEQSAQLLGVVPEG
jgi:hypothetical protein